LENDGDGGWRRWRGGFKAGDGSDGLRRADDPGGGRALDEGGGEVDGVEGALGGDVEGGGGYGGDGEGVVWRVVRESVIGKGRGRTYW
jgi:hypothetical protein